MFLLQTRIFVMCPINQAIAYIGCMEIKIQEVFYMSKTGFGDCGTGFALIVVLFILLIIVGASWCF